MDELYGSFFDSTGGATATQDPPAGKLDFFFDEHRANPAEAYRQVGSSWARQIGRRVLSADASSWRGAEISKQRILDAVDRDVPLARERETFEKANPNVPFDEQAVRQSAVEQVQGDLLKQRLQRFREASTSEKATAYVTPKLPGVGVMAGASAAARVYQSVQNLKNDRATLEDFDNVARAIADDERAAQRGLVRKYLDVLSEAPSFLAEWSMTGGAGAAGRGAATAGVKRLIGGLAENRAVGAAIGAVGEGVARAGTAGLPHIAADFTRRVTPAVGVDDDRVVVGPDAANPGAELARAAGAKVIADTAFSAIGGPPGLHAAEPIRRALPKAILASESAQEASWGVGAADRGGVLSRLIRKDPEAVADFLVQSGAFLTLETAARVVPRLIARSQELRGRGLADHVVAKALVNEVEQQRRREPEQRTTTDTAAPPETPPGAPGSSRTRSVPEPAQRTPEGEIVRPEPPGATPGAPDAGTPMIEGLGRPAVPDSPLWRWADQLEQSAIAELRALGHGDQLFSVSPDTFEPLVRYAAARVIKGGYSATMFARDAVKQFGEAVRPHVESLWNRAQAALRDRGAELRRRVEAGEQVALAEVFEAAGLTPTQREVAVARTETSMSDLARQRGTSKQAVNNIETGALERLEQIGLPVASLEQSVVLPGRNEALLAAVERGQEQFTHTDPNTGRTVTERVRRADRVAMKELSGQHDPETGERLPAAKVRGRVADNDRLRDELSDLTDLWLKETTRANNQGLRLAPGREAHFQAELGRLHESIGRAEHPEPAAARLPGDAAGRGREPRPERAEPRAERAERAERPQPAARPVAPPKPADPLAALRTELRAVTDAWYAEAKQAGRRGLRLPAERDAYYRGEADRLRVAITEARRDADLRQLAGVMREVVHQDEAPLKPPAIRMAEKWEAEAGDVLRELGSGEKLMAGFDPAVLEALGKLVGAKILRGGYSAGQLAKDLGERFGAEAVQHADAIWQRAQVIAQGASTSIANAIAQEERSRRGLQPAVQEASRSFGQVWGEALRTAERGPEAQDVLIAELAQKPRAVTDREDALLLHRQLELQQRYDQVVAQLEQARQSGEPATVVELEHSEALLRGRLQTLYDVNAKVGTETGRGLNARKMLARQDHSLGHMMVQRQAAKGADLTPAERQEVVEANEKIADLQSRLDARDALDARRRVEAVMGGSDQNVAELTREILERDVASKADRVQLHDEAYAALKEFGVTPSSLHNVRRQGRDAASVRGIDEAAADLAKRYPGLFPEGENPSDTLFRLLSEGKPKTMTRAEAMAQAKEQLAEVAAVFGDDQGDAFEPLVGGQAPAPRRLRAASARQQVDAAWAELRTLTAGKLFSNPVDPELLVATAKLARAYVKLGVAKVQDFVSAIRERSGKPLTPEAEAVLVKGWDAAQGELASERRQAALKRLDGVDPADTARVSRAARGLARDAVQSIRDRDGVVAFVKQQLEPIIPGITDRQVMDAISGYGQYKELSKDDVSAKLRDVQGQLRQVAKLEDLRAGQRPLPTGAERRTPSAEEQQLAEQVRELQRQAGVGDADPAKQRASALAAAKTRMRSEIDSLADAVATGQQRMQRSGRVKPDAELAGLMRVAARLREDYDAAFGRKGYSDEQRLRIATAAAHRGISDLQDRIDAKEFSRRGGGPAVNSAALQALRAKRQALQAEFEQLRAADPAARRSAEEQALRAVKANLTRRVADYQDRLARGDFAPVEKKPARSDAEVEKLRYELDQAKQDWRVGLQKAERANESAVTKVFRQVGNFLDLQRAWKLGGDVPPALRQGGMVTAAHPLLSAEALAATAKAFRSDFDAHQAAAELASRENARNGLYRRAMNLDVADARGGDEFLQGNWIQKVPVFGRLERWNSAYLTRLRADAFDLLTAGLSRTGKPTEAEARILGNAVNVFTGRGNLFAAEQAVGFLNKLFLAPKWVASRFQLLLPVPGNPLLYGLREYGLQPRARLAVAKEYVRASAGVATVYGLVGLATAAGLEGVTVETDPRSTDFGEIRVGNTRFNPLFGLRQVATFVSRLVTASTKTGAGTIAEQPPINTIASETRNKLAPVPSAAYTAGELTFKAMGYKRVKPPPGYPQSFEELGKDVVTPITLNDFSKAAADLGLPAGIASWLWASLGGGLKSYGPKGEQEPAGR